MPYRLKCKNGSVALPRLAALITMAASAHQVCLEKSMEEQRHFRCTNKTWGKPQEWKISLINIELCIYWWPMGNIARRKGPIYVVLGILLMVKHK
jgi:hypothetical protein